jgi:hypothetical protein
MFTPINFHYRDVSPGSSQGVRVELPGTGKGPESASPRYFGHYYNAGQQNLVLDEVSYCHTVLVSLGVTY